MPAYVKLTKGTIEQVPIKITDALENLTSLSGKDLRYDLYKADDPETVVSTNSAASNDGLIALPLIDTTGLAEGFYNIYISFVVTPQTIRKGPFKILVDD